MREVNDRVLETIRGIEDRIAGPELPPEGARLVEQVTFAAAGEIAS